MRIIRKIYFFLTNLFGGYVIDILGSQEEIIDEIFKLLNKLF